VEALRPWLFHDQVLTCGVIRCEALRGVVNEKVRSRMRELFDAMQALPVTESTWDETERLAWSLDRRGVVLPLTDLVIACCALRMDATVITTDAHFREVPKLKVGERLPDIT
jgi:predicted nucleic acid-binding protein